MNRRDFLVRTARASLLIASGTLPGVPRLVAADEPRAGAEVPGASPGRVTLFLAGDVMTGRGIDQALPHSVDPRLHEAHVTDARRYVELAEEANGPLARPLPYEAVWGDALAELERVAPDVRIVNLETSVTTHHEPWPGKVIHYRMHPHNVPLLTTAGLDVCVLGNNHVMDWGVAGLRETLDALQEAGLGTAGAGRDQEEAATPAIVDSASGRLLVFSYGTPSAGVPGAWQAAEDRPGVNLLADLSLARADEVAEHVRAHREEGDRVVVSLHWGGNWGHAVPAERRSFAHRLVDAGAADVVHGHSSHHPQGLEVYGGRLILYGAGDLLNDYEGIGGRSEFRGDLTLLYFPVLDASGRLLSLEMTPMRIRNFGLVRAAGEEVAWLARTLDRESRTFGTGVHRIDDGRLAVAWE